MGKRKIVKTVFIVLGLMIFALSMPFIIWRFEPTKNLNVLIIDKTVPDTTYREHSGFMWILNNLKIKMDNSEAAFKYDKDYYGFFPLPNQKYDIKELPANLQKPDLLYLADTYGVYNDDFYKSNTLGNRSGIIYGGMKIDEVEKIKKALNNNTIIGEFNTLASPTDTKSREELENIFGLKWGGWIGRYFSDLSKENIEIPNWMKENYAMQYGEKWNFKGAGIVLVDSKDSIIVLRKDIELGKGLININFTDNAKQEFHVKNNLNYYYWFEINRVDKDTQELAKYKLDLTAEGKKLLDKYNLPNEFPAIVRKTGNYTSYYFSGDFADSNSIPKTYSASGIQFLNKITTFNEDTNQNYFYWNVYYPLIKNIIKNVN
jgi:hypothetical protein